MARGDLWFKFYPSDWLRDTRSMSLEQRGAYIDSIAMQMERGGPLPDDMAWLAHQMHISKRKAAAIVEELIEICALKREGDTLTNPRCEREIAAREHQRKVNTEIASTRERTKRESTLSQTRTKRENSAKVLPLNREKSKSDNKINAPSEISCNEASTTRARSRIEVEENRKEEEKTHVDEAPSALALTGVSDVVDLVSVETQSDGVPTRRDINRQAAQIAFDEWRVFATRVGLSCPKPTSFAVFGKKIATRMLEHAAAPKGLDEMLAVWRQAIANVDRSSFLRGFSKPNFSADLKFMCQRESFAKVLDGGYGNGAHAYENAQPAETYVDRMRRLMGADAVVSDAEIIPPERHLR